MNAESESLLEYHLITEPSYSIAITGNCAESKSSLCYTLSRHSLSYAVIDTVKMPSLEAIHEWQRRNTEMRNGKRLWQSFIRGLLAVNQIFAMPQVLIFDKFNLRHPTETYIIKSLIDTNMREDDECYAALKSIVLLIQKPDTEKTYDIDPDVIGCIRNVVPQS